MTEEVMECDNQSGEENGNSNAMRMDIYLGICSSTRASCHEQISGDSINTLYDALNYFGLLKRFSEIEESLEAVRRNKISKENHEARLKEFDWELQTLSRKHHPDKVKNRGGSQVELEEAQKLQTALNATKTVFSCLNKTFLEDLDIDHKYEFFSNLEIGVLGNEDQLQNLVYGVLFKISFLSEIKQQRIVAVIHKFLVKSQNCLKSFLSNNEPDFKRNCDLAMMYLEKCIQGYEKLVEEYEEVEEECTQTKVENMATLLRKMKRDASCQLRNLKMLQSVATDSLKKPLRIFNTSETITPLDDYYVLPFVLYINIILMCHAMTKPVKESRLQKLFRNGLFEFFTHFTRSSYQKQSFTDKDTSSCDVLYLANNYGGNSQHEEAAKKDFHEVPNSGGIEDIGASFIDAYHLASYYRGYSQHKEAAMKVLLEMPNNGRIEDVFRRCVEKIHGILESQFKLEEYTVRSCNIQTRKELKICMTMMDTFDTKVKQFAKEVAEFKKETQEMKKQYEMNNEIEGFGSTSSVVQDTE